MAFKNPFNEPEQFIAVVVFTLLIAQLVSIALAPFVKQWLNLDPTVKLGEFFILACFALALVSAWVIVINRQFKLETKDFIGMGIVVLVILAILVFLPRTLPTAFNDSTLNNLRGIGLLSAAPINFDSIQVGGVSVQDVANGFNWIVAFLTPFFSLLLLLAGGLYVHFNKQIKKGWNTFWLGTIGLFFVLVSLTTAYASTFGGIV